eukprot:3600998-Rhodomonas_salina.2
MERAITSVCAWHWQRTEPFMRVACEDVDECKVEADMSGEAVEGSALRQCVSASSAVTHGTTNAREDCLVQVCFRRPWRMRR